AGFSAELQSANSGVVVRPIIFKPALRIFFVKKLSDGERLPCINKDPCSCRRPCTVGPKSFIKKGKPANGPSTFVPSEAGFSKASAKTSITALMSGFTFSTPWLTCSATSRGVISPLFINAASPKPSYCCHSSQLIARVIFIAPLLFIFFYLDYFFSQ